MAKKLMILAFVACLLLIGCAEGDLFPDFHDINVELVVPDIAEGEFTVVVVPDGPYPEYVIKGYVEFQNNVATVELWSVEVGGVSITPREARR